MRGTEPLWASSTKRALGFSLIFRGAPRSRSTERPDPRNNAVGSLRESGRPLRYPSVLPAARAVHWASRDHRGQVSFPAGALRRSRPDATKGWHACAKPKSGRPPGPGTHSQPRARKDRTATLDRPFERYSSPGSPPDAARRRPTRAARSIRIFARWH